MTRLGAHVYGDEDVRRRAGAGLAAGDQVRAGAAHGVFDHVGEEGGEDQAHGEPEHGAVVLMEGRSPGGAGAGGGGGDEGVPEK